MVTKKQISKEWKSLEVEIPLEDGCSVTYERGLLSIKGAKGEVSKMLKFPNVYFKTDGNSVKIGTEKFSKNEKKIIHTYRAHVKNMLKGVTEGFEYKLTVVFAKFPITVELNGNTFTVKNLLGEKVPRVCAIPSDVEVKVSGKDITVTGINKESVGQVAGTLEQLTRINHLDRRVIQDGIYIVEKPHRRYV